MDKKRVLVIASTYPRWREDHEPAFVHELSRRLTSDFEVFVICPHASGAERCELMDGVWVHRFRYAPDSLESLVQNGGIIANLKSKPWKWLLVVPFLVGLLLSCFFLIRKIKPDVIHAHWLIPQGAVLSILKLILHLPPIMLTSHGGDLFGLKGSFFTLMKKRVFSSVACITVVSNKMRDLSITLGANPASVHVLPMGVDFTKKFSPDPTVSRDPSNILYVGRLVEKKGVKYLIEAFAETRRVIPSATLTIVGYGPEEPALREMAERLGLAAFIDFRGGIKQVLLPGLYCACAVVVAPFIEAESGDQEGFPVALVEAIACGTPIIAGNLDVLVEAFGDSADELTCNVKDIKQLAERVMSVMRSSIANEAAVLSVRKKLRDELDWSAVADHYKVLLRKLIG